ncbi:RNA-guided endonuclease InsQ/TnpB family protein [Streptomyces sp. NPDC056112]|uniref:RNA-guided endonuclease InsQ/TnpB family protein n=1 Tax=Streptomyces sp. NPDC056112 TaxID=3345715 RepID=UPI0035D67969
MQLRYSFRLYPTARQRSELAKAFGCVRVVYNDALRVREAARAAGLPFVTPAELSKQLTAAKRTPERAWLSEVSSVVLQQSLRDLEAAYQKFFNGLKGKNPRHEPPRHKTRKDNRHTIRFVGRRAWKVTPGGKLRLPKIGDVKVKWSRRLPSLPSSVTVIKDSAGRYFASFVVTTDPAEDLKRMPEASTEVGIDLGLTHFAILSDGTKVTSPRFLRRAEKRLKKAHRGLRRKEKGGRNWEKTRAKVARQYARVADSRRNFHHQLSTKLIRENQAIAVENLSVKGLARTRLDKSVHDAGWSTFVTMLEYKAARYGRTFVRIGRFEPTSQVCSQCGVKDGPKPLHVRVWTCGACGAVLDRDINAAVNVAKAAGLAVSACGAQVRPGLVPAQRNEAGTHPKLPHPRGAEQQAGVLAPVAGGSQRGKSGHGSAGVLRP